MIINISPELEQGNLDATLERDCRGLNRKFGISAPNEAVKEWPVQTTHYHLDYFNMVTMAYSSHHGIVLAPHDAWLIVLSRLAAIVTQDPDTYRKLFTDNEEGKETILVPQDHPYRINKDKLLAAIALQAKFAMSDLMPEFSTATPGYDEAAQVMVLDASSQFYDYGMFCCGLRFVDLRGTIADWDTAIMAVNEMMTLLMDQGLDKTKLFQYFIDVHRFLDICAMTLEGNAPSDFWRDFYTHKNVGSGGDLQVTGNICTLLNVKPGSLVKSVGAAVGQLKYKNYSTNEEFVMLSGAFGSNVTPEGALEAVYSSIIIQIEDQK